MSKSVGNVIGPQDLVERYGTDALRYFFLREVPFGQDGNYSHEAIVNRTNADLANDLGNLAQRSLSMIGKNCGGKLPLPDVLTEADLDILAQAAALPAKAREQMQDYALHQILADIWRVVAEANRYFASEEPWTKKKTDPRRMETVLYVTAEVLRIVAIMALPFTPAAMAKLLDLLKVQEEKRLFSEAALTAGLEPGIDLPAPAPIFPRYVEPEEGAKGS
jgi:methionyl-tRNA synthetase